MPRSPTSRRSCSARRSVDSPPPSPPAPMLRLRSCSPPCPAAALRLASSGPPCSPASGSRRRTGSRRAAPPPRCSHRTRFSAVPRASSWSWAALRCAACRDEVRRPCRASLGPRARPRRGRPFAAGRRGGASTRLAAPLALRLPVPRRHLLALPRLRVHARLRGGCTPASRGCAHGKPARGPGGARLRRARSVDGAAPVRASLCAQRFRCDGRRAARCRGRAGRKLAVPGTARRAVIAVALLASYLAGSAPFGLLVARIASGKDVRTVGSGNIGATNVARAAGRTAALVTLLLDALKGFLPALLAERTLAEPCAAAACGVGAVIGHCFPV